MMNIEELRVYFETLRPVLHYFPHTVGAELSDVAATLLYDLHGRIMGRAKPLVRNGKYWAYDAMRLLVEAHPYCSESGVRKALLALENAGYIQIEKSGKYNRKRYDRKWWYHITAKGIAAAQVRLIRYNPEVAVLLDIPKAVLLQNVHYQLHQAGSDGYALLDPDKLQVPHSSRALRRHLQELVDRKILVQDQTRKWHFKPMLENWRSNPSPLTVFLARLLPPIKAGDLGLLTGASGAGKTAVATFMATQAAVAGKGVLYVVLEDKVSNLSNRVLAQESAQTYGDLYQNEPHAWQAVKDLLAAGGERVSTWRQNLRFLDLSGQHPTAARVLSAIQAEIAKGFVPDLVIVDQLEFISGDDHDAANSDDTPYPSRAEAAAAGVSSHFVGLPYPVWFLHQVNGDPQWDHTLKNVSGGTVVTDQFTCCVGLGRASKDAPELHVFSMTPGIVFEEVLEADFPRMRFKPKMKKSPASEK